MRRIIQRLSAGPVDDRDEQIAGLLAELAEERADRELLSTTIATSVDRLRTALGFLPDTRGLADLLFEVEQRLALAADQLAAHESYHQTVMAHGREIDRAIGELRAELADAVAERDRLREIETLAVREQDELRAELRVLRGTAADGPRVLPEPVQALVDWYLRESVTAVLALPSRQSIRAALEAWAAPAPGVCEKCHLRLAWKPEQAGLWPGGHFCEPCITACHEEVAGHMCVIDRWRPATLVDGRTA